MGFTGLSDEKRRPKGFPNHDWKGDKLDGGEALSEGGNVLMSFIQRSGSGANVRTHLGKTTRQDGYLRHRN